MSKDVRSELLGASRMIRTAISHCIRNESVRDCALDNLSFISSHSFPLYTDKDGKPIRGDVDLYGSDGTLWCVDSFECGALVTYPINAHKYGDRSVRRHLKPEWLSRNKPDSVESLLNDMLGWISEHESSDGGYTDIADFTNRLNAIVKDKERMDV